MPHFPWLLSDEPDPDPVDQLLADSEELGQQQRPLNTDADDDCQEQQ